MTPWTTRLCCAAATVALLAATGCTATGGNATAEPSQAGFLPATRAYCVEKGGTVQERQPMYGTNNARESWVPLGEPVEVCQFRTTDPSASQINLDLVTLYSTHPTLAALAYLAKAPVPSDGSVNPAYLLCVSLGGGSAYGTGAAGGGLYLDNAGEGELGRDLPEDLGGRQEQRQWRIDRTEQQRADDQRRGDRQARADQNGQQQRGIGEHQAFSSRAPSASWASSEADMMPKRAASSGCRPAARARQA